MADSDKTVAYGVSADASGFEAGMQKAADSARDAAGQIDSHFKKVQAAFGEVQKTLLLLAGIVAGGAFFKDAINASNSLTAETLKLSKSLGITGTEAGTLNTALKDIGSNGDDYVAVFTKFARQLKSNEEGLKALGLQTRDANGNLRDSSTLFTEALQSVGQYKAGLDQNTYAQTVFGKSIDDVMKLQKLNNQVLEDARKKNEELGLVVSQDNVAASKAYKLAMNDVGDVLLAVQKTVGDAVMPVFTELAQYFASTGPYVVAVFKGAMLTLLGAFDVIKATVKTVAGVVFEAFALIVDGAGMIGEVFSKLFSGDFSGAYESAKNLGKRVGQAFSGAFANFIEAATDIPDAMQKNYDRLYGDKKALDAPKGGDKTMGKFRQKGSHFDTEIGDLQAQEAAFKHNMDAKLALLEQELTRTKALYGEDSKEYANVQKRIVETKRQAAEQQKQIDIERSQGVRNASLSELQTRQQQVQFERDMGTITQQELLTKQAAFEQQKNSIALDALKERERIALADPDKNIVELERIHQQMQQAEREHQARMNEIRMQSLKESQRYTMGAIDSMGSGFQSVFQQAMQGSVSLTGAMRGMWQALTNAVTGALAKMAADWLILQVKDMIFGKVVAESKIAAYTAAAGAGGVASMAAAPWPMDMTAPAFGAEMAAAAAAFAPMASAAGGYDIPGTINPITQLHASEMVLPAKHADVIRNMADQGGGGGAGDSFTVQIHATDAQSVARLFRDNGDALVKALASRKRDFAF